MEALQWYVDTAPMLNVTQIVFLGTILMGEMAAVPSEHTRALKSKNLHVTIWVVPIPHTICSIGIVSSDLALRQTDGKTNV